MANAFKRTPTSKKWTATFTGADGKTKKAAGFSDKASTLRLARKLEDEAYRKRLGLVDEAGERTARQSREPIIEHLDGWIAALASKGTGTKQLKRMRGAVKAAIADAGWTSPKDVDADGFASHMATLRAKGKGDTTMKTRGDAVRAFTRWMAQTHRIVRDPLSHVRPVKKTTEDRVRRRALTEAEIVELLRFVDNAGDEVIVEKKYRYKGALKVGKRRLKIPNRGTLYRVMLSTGFRVSEVRSLRAGDFRLGDDPPTATVRAGYSKNRREAVQPIPLGLADLLRPLVDRLGPDDRPWGTLPESLAKVVAHDLEAARSAWIDEAMTETERRQRIKSDHLRREDAAGRIVDGHALRHTFITMLAKSNAPLRVLQELARHSDPRLTTRVYSHVRLTDSARVLDALPEYVQHGPAGERAAARSA